MPAFNESERIREIINEIKNKSDNIIVCNDGSTDSTGIIAEKMAENVLKVYQKILSDKKLEK